MTPEWVSPEKLHDVWDWVRKGCEVVRKRSKAKWLVEDVYAQIKAGNSSLFLIEDKGFIVLNKSADFSGPTLFVWVIYGDLREVEQEMWAWLRVLRDKGGFKSVWWLSPRRWDCRDGVKLTQHLYELE